MVESQIGNLTPGPSFGHNLCLKCPNGSCEPILDIYVPRAFHWFKELINLLNFDPYNCSLKILESTWTPNSQSGSSFGSVKVHSLGISYTPKSMRRDSQASLLTRNLASPCLGHPTLRLQCNTHVIPLGYPRNTLGSITWNMEGNCIALPKPTSKIIPCLSYSVKTMG